METTYTCDSCGRTFANHRSLAVHKKKHEGIGHRCPTCNEQFAESRNLQKHRERCGKLSCDLCDERFTWMYQLNGHHKANHLSRKRPAMPSSHTAKRQHMTTPETNNHIPHQYNPIPDGMSEEVRRIYVENRSSIATRPKLNKVQDIFNFEITSTDNKTIEKQLWDDVFDKQSTKFKINASYGFILRNQQTNQYRYYHPSQNNSRVLDIPHFVADADNFREFLRRMENSDILEWAKQQRPDSKWIVERVCNVSFYVNKIVDHPIGGSVDLPDFILNKKSIVALQSNKTTGARYTDNLCLFRCLAVHNKHSTREVPAKRYFKQYAGEDSDFREFKGVRLSEIPSIEKLFNVTITIYELEQVDDKTVAKLVQRSHTNYPNKMYLNIYDNHFSYISDFSKYSSSFACRKCGQCWSHGGMLNRHEKTCDTNTTHQYVGGVYHTTPTIFERLEDEGIVVEEERRYFPYRATFDYECYFNKDNAPQGTDKLEWTAEHRPLSVSVCSNISGYQEPKCFVTTGDSKTLVTNMMEYLGEMQEVAYNKLSVTYSDIFQELSNKINDITAREYEATGHDSKKPHPLQKLHDDFDKYIRELPVIGFNSGKYDINVIKSHLVEYIVSKGETVDFVVKRNSNFMCFKTQNLKFLDILNYLAPGFNYDKFLRAYGAQTTKGFFPYEWMDNLTKLDEKELPSHEDFFSKLKNTNISDDDYQYCQTIWKTNEMETFRDFLTWYNDRDVGPMIDALQNVFDFYKERHIDMFKDGISVPGLTLKYLFSHLDDDTYFTLIDERNKDLHRLIKDNIVGGPSIIFNRYHEQGITHIRDIEYMEQAKVCEGVSGWDANSLYLWALSQDMPTGWFVRRRVENKFQPEKVQKYGRMAVSWLDWVSVSQHIDIRHQQNGREKRIGRRKLPVDGWCAKTQTIYNFHGCLWHGHRCALTTDKNGEYLQHNPVNKRLMSELRQETEANAKYMKDLGYNVVELWECQWQVMLKEDHTIAEFVSEFHDHKVKGAMTDVEIVSSVKTGELFGLVECDISVPDSLKPYFSEMPPIFKNVNISRGDIGEFMGNYAEEHNIMTQPRKSLIGSYFGNKILLATPLLKWYLEHGLEVTKVYQVVEFQPKPCFKSFADSVADARRMGDLDESTQIVAETSKLVGNAAYGKTGTNKEKHRDVKYCGEDDVSKLINKSRFRQLNSLGNDVYEVEMCKKKIKMDLPHHIAYFVYQYAKLKMLDFYFEFMDKYIDRMDYEYCEMDTDSAYIALSAPTLEDVLKPSMVEEFYSNVQKWFPVETCDVHRDEYVRAKCNGEDWQATQPCCTDRYMYCMTSVPQVCLN